MERESERVLEFLRGQWEGRGQIGTKREDRVMSDKDPPDSVLTRTNVWMWSKHSKLSYIYDKNTCVYKIFFFLLFFLYIWKEIKEERYLLSYSVVCFVLLWLYHCNQGHCHMTELPCKFQTVNQLITIRGRGETVQRIGNQIKADMNSLLRVEVQWDVWTLYF